MKMPSAIEKVAEEGGIRTRDFESKHQDMQITFLRPRSYIREDKEFFGGFLISQCGKGEKMFCRTIYMRWGGNAKANRFSNSRFDF